MKFYLEDSLRKCYSHVRVNHSVCLDWLVAQKGPVKPLVLVRAQNLTFSASRLQRFPPLKLGKTFTVIVHDYLYLSEFVLGQQTVVQLFLAELVHLFFIIP